MIVPPPKRNRSMDDNILPLINVVFLLLIFFVIAGAITQNAPFGITLPTSQHSADRTIPADSVLSIAADGRLAFGGEPVDAAALAHALSERPDNQPLQVRADSDLNARQLSDTLGQLRDMGVAEVRLLTQHQQP